MVCACLFVCGNDDGGDDDWVRWTVQIDLAFKGIVFVYVVVQTPLTVTWGIFLNGEFDGAVM